MSIPKGACERYQVVAIPNAHLDRVPSGQAAQPWLPCWFSTLYKAIAIVLSLLRELEQEIWTAGD